MRSFSEIFAIWDKDRHVATRLMAAEIGAKADTVRKWHKGDHKGRIPQEHWTAVIEAAAKRGVTLTVVEIMTANAAMGQRGKPAHKKKKHAKSRKARARHELVAQ